MVKPLWSRAVLNRVLEFRRVRTMSSAEPLSAVRQRLLQHEAARQRAAADMLQAPHDAAAVLIALFHNPADDEVSLLLTLRSSKLKRHSGEVACPGGRHEEGDHNPVDTALREAREEIGLPPHRVDVVTQLPPHPTRGGALVVPVVGFVPTNFSPVLQRDEVDAVFRMPLRLLLDERDHSAYMTDYRGGQFPMHSFNYADQETGRTYRVWGFTAQVCMTVASIALARQPSFPATLWHYDMHRTELKKSSKL